MGDMASRRALTGGGLWVLLYLVASALLAPGTLHSLVSATFVLLPAVVAAMAAWRAGHDAGFRERTFWWFLAVASAAGGLAGTLFVSQHALRTRSSFLGLGAQLAWDTQLVLAVVALLVRPDRPAHAGEKRAAILEWSMAVVAGYVLAFDLGPLSRGGSPQGSLGDTLRSGIPALAALVLAAKVRLEAFKRAYLILAAGFGAGGLASLLGFWLQGVPRPQGPWLVAWVLPVAGVAAAAWRAQGQELEAPPPEPGKTAPPWLAPLAIALPPLVDLATRIGGLFPDGVEARSTLTLASTLVLVILCALRVHPRSMVLPAVQGWDERGPATARDSLEFASGVAHELNNPLMAVAGWAEVALKKGAPTLPMHQLIEATRAAADAVARLDQITRGPAGTRG